MSSIKQKIPNMNDDIGVHIRKKLIKLFIVLKTFHPLQAPPQVRKR